MFQKIEQYDAEEIDTRFIKGKVWICHSGSNYNGSYFSEETIIDALPSLANTPILCFYTTNKEGENDFGGHEYQLEKINGELDLVCKEYAIGVFSEADIKTAKMEDRLCDDGIIRRFATCECTLWTKFNQAMSIFEKQNVKSQSMEITDVEGEFQDDNLYHMNKFHFNGCTILSNDVSPAMANASIEVNFSNENNKSIAKEIENKLNEFAKYFSKKEDDEMAKKVVEDKVKDTQSEEDFAKSKTQKSEEDLEIENNSKTEENFDTQDDSSEDDQSIAEVIEDVAEVLDEIEDAIDNGSDEENEDFGCKKNEMSCDEDMKDKDMEDMSSKDKSKMSKEDDVKQYTVNFSLSYEDIRSQLLDKLWDMGNIENTYYGIIKTMDNYFVYCDCMTGQFFEQAYTKTDDSVIFIGERKEVFNILVDQETKDSMTAVTYSKLQKDLEVAYKKIEEYSKANEELLKFQLDIKENERKGEIDKVISNFSKINELDLEKYRQKAYNKEISKEQLEDKLYAELGKMNFSKITGEEVEEKIEIPVNYTVSLDATNQNKCPYDGCEVLFSKNK
jgi:hypothetical protein